MSERSASSEAESDNESVDWVGGDSDWEEENYSFHAFHSDETFASLQEMLNYEKEKHDFDFAAVCRNHKLDLYGSIKLVNYLRTQREEGVPVKIDNTLNLKLAEERYLHPVMENDAVLFHLVDEEPEDRLEKSVEQKLNELEAKYAALQQSVQKTLAKEAGISQEPKKRDNDTYYFNSYGYNDIHETMLKDTVRTDAYRDFIYDNKDIFRDKTVLDVGCGTGILSMFAVKAGAKHVYAIDNSTIIDKARANAHENEIDDDITFIRGKIEEITLPVSKVDIIISEWMGYALLYEAMLDSVLCARDRFLAADGIMAPSCTTLLIAGLSDLEYYDDRVNFWNDVYGFKMGAMKDGIYDDVLVDHLPSTSLGTDVAIFKTLDIHTVSISDLVFESKFTLQVNPGQSTIVAFHIWFDTFFSRTRIHTPKNAILGKIGRNETTAFTTGPFGKATHWKQAILLIDRHLQVSDGDVIHGQIRYEKHTDHTRDLVISVSWELVRKQERNDREGASGSPGKQTWRLQ